MSEALSLILRALHAGGGLLLLGTLVLLALSASVAAEFPFWRRALRRAALLLCAATALLGLAVFALQLTAVPASGTSMQTAKRLLLESRFGHVWLARELILACALVPLTLGLEGSWRRWIALLLACAQLAIAPLSGHAAAIEPAWPALLASAAHVLAVGAWWGALPALVAMVLMTRRARATARHAAVHAFMRFSALALPLMGLIVLSGIALALAQVERWPALLGTRYGALLLLKLALLCMVLCMAARLRWRLLPALGATSEPRIAGLVARWIVTECIAGALIVGLASGLRQTIPARHDAIDWWLPFRFSLEATWDLRWTPEQVIGGVAAALLGFALWPLWRSGRVRGRWAPAAGGALVVAGTAVALHALSVDAYRDTYRRPSVTYQTLSVAAGADLFQAHCAGCHGRTGKGDGELGRGLPARPADLTEPHTALHTAGDIFWWLTHGKPPGFMPGFADRLSEDDRWDLINFLRTVSAGYQARILTERIVPGRPWLPAIDFNFTTRDGTSGTLKDYRERSALLLVFFTWPQSAQRLTRLAQDVAPLRTAGAEILAISLQAVPTAQPVALPQVEEGAVETARSYALLRRTLANADSRDEQPLPQHMELLVDRFGYVRARWLPQEGAGWEDTALLREQIILLRGEPQVRPPPQDHVH
jgi:putative copper resistance protein D